MTKYKAKLIIVSDFSFQGSGYFSIAAPLALNLSKMGYDIKVVGLGYTGEPHNFPYSIIPCASHGEAHAMVNNLRFQWKADLVIVALDIPQQAWYIDYASTQNFPIISIVPLENPPLTMSWAIMLQQSRKVFFISQLGADEAVKAGVENAEHLVVGMDTESWRLRTKEEYEKGREIFNISPDTLVVLTVADNQERKNLSKAMEIVSKVKKEKGIKVKYILITRENSEVGWKLRDLALSYGIASETMIFERGLSFGELYSFYAISDAFLLTSKDEGLGMPVMEAMCVGVPVVATNCGAMPELLGEGRGFLMETEYSMIDPWGNSRRDFPNAESGVAHLGNIFEFGRMGNHEPFEATIRARKYMELEREVGLPGIQVNRAIEEILNETKQA